MTGLDPCRHQIIEIAAAWVDPGNFGVIDRFYTLVGPKPGQSLDTLKASADPAALAVNRINLDHVEYCPSPRVAVMQLQQWLPGPPGDFQLVGHNLMLDFFFLSKAVEDAEQAGLPVKPFSFDYIDTFGLANLLSQYPEFSRRYSVSAAPSLSKLAKSLGINSTAAHRADADVEMTRKVLKKLLEHVDIVIERED
jgi:DNA polymerase III alpha subunit (gram-positive type)